MPSPNPKTRYIDIDTDTRVGFNYIKNQYYVTNKGYTTYRNTVDEIQEVIFALNITNITDEELLELKDDMEELYKVSYTLQDTGAYIHTLQFNDFKKYPLTLDCEKKKLYIMNSTIIYDLTLNESPRNVRIPRILSFYKNTLGLLITTHDMSYFYSLLLSYYYPTCYNQVMYNTDTKKYFYNNKFILSNYSNTSEATYICTYNPNNNAELTEIGKVIETNTTNNTITLSQDIAEETLQGYNKVILQGTTQTIDGSQYSADGEYTITKIEGNTIQVAETIPTPYQFPFKECYVLASQDTISSMNRDTRQITLTETPQNILVGDIILVSGATVPTEYETISCNGTYTVESITDNIITVEEEIPTDFTGEATLIKEVFISNISKIYNKKLTLTDTTDLDLTGATILIHTIENEETTIENYTVSSYTTNTITVSESIGAYNFTNYAPTLYIPIPNNQGDVETLVDITSVSDKASSSMPLGEFMVDSFEQCQDYLGTLSGLVTPSEKNKLNLYKEVQELSLDTIPNLTTAKSTDSISWINPNVEGMTFQGLYSQVYTD